MTIQNWYSLSKQMEEITKKYESPADIYKNQDKNVREP